MNSHATEVRGPAGSGCPDRDAPERPAPGPFPPAQSAAPAGRLRPTERSRSPLDPAGTAGTAGDDLGTASLTIDRLRAFLHGPTTAAEHAAALRRPDGPTQGRRW